MIRALKKRLYFVVASYFAFWAKYVLRRWHPRIVIITGSSGKTTVLHLLEAQIGDKAVYSHHANGAIGIPFHILGLRTNVPSKPAWLIYFLVAPFHAFRKPPKQDLYIVEADCDRPHEGFFTANFLNPEVTLWVSVSRTHSMNFDNLVKSKKFTSHEDAIAHEFGYFAAYARKLVLANGDQELLVKELKRVKPKVAIKQASVSEVQSYKVNRKQTTFKIKGQTIEVPGLQPKKLGVSLQLIDELLEYLDIELDPSYSRFVPPPGRSNQLSGKKDTVLIDSTYNTGLDATSGVLELFSHYPNNHRWAVIGDILEQGGNDKQEHVALAKVLEQESLERIILLGRRTNKYTYPLLEAAGLPVVSFMGPKEVLNYLKAEIKGGEAILFKGAQGLEGVVEQLLENPDDASKLVRRDSAWVKRRQNWGLPR